MPENGQIFLFLVLKDDEECHFFFPLVLSKVNATKHIKCTLFYFCRGNPMLNALDSGMYILACIP